jgi:hypothetical protein
MKKIKIRFSLLLFSFAITITSCSILRGNYTRNWHGSDNPGHIYASFDGFNGHQDFNAVPFSGTKMKVKYSTDVTAGTMALVVTCNGTPVLDRDVTGTIRDSVTFDNPNHNPVQFTLKAKNAAGKFDITY